MPTFNRVEFIGLAVDSALSQTFKDLELIVIDDGSTDGSRELLDQYRSDKRFRYYYQENQGQSVARNKGIKEAKGEFIAFLDSDNIWYLDKLKKQLKEIQIFQNYDIYYSDSLPIDVNGNEIPHECMSKYSGIITNHLLRDNCVSMNTVLIRKKCFAELGDFDTEDRFAEDYELWLRMSTKYKFHYSSGYSAKYRIMENQISTDKNQRFISNESVLLDFLKRFPDAVSVADKKRGMSFFYARRARYEISQHYFSHAYSSIIKSLMHDSCWMGPWRTIVVLLLTALKIR